MGAKLRYVEIKKLFGQYDVEWDIEKDTTVLVGQNGSGKTTILRIIMLVLLKEFNTTNELINSFSSCILKDNTGHKNEFDERDALIALDSIVEKIYEEILSIFQEDKQDAITKKLEERIKNLHSKKNLDKHPVSNKIKLLVEFISTLNMSANATNNITASDGIPVNILDMEIEQAINKFQKLGQYKDYISIQKKIITVLNDFFSATKKNVYLTKKDFTIKTIKKDVLELSQLSAGERQIIYIVFKVATAYFNEALILMDEPEISLHLEWQEKLLKNLREINDKSQMIVVTHSPAIIMDGWMDSYVDIQMILKPIKDDE